MAGAFLDLPDGPLPQTDPGTDVDAVLARLAQRRSCRAFDGSPIDPAVLEEIVADGIQAPSSCNHQNWHFVVLTEPALKRRAREISGGNTHFAECSALIYLCFQQGWTHDKFSIVQSVAGACYHMMLSAHLRGFACIWNAGIGDTGQLAELMGVPPIFEIQGALAIGRPKPTAPAMKAPRRPVRDVMSWQRFARPAVSLYPAKPAPSYRFTQISNACNPFAEWDPAVWGWDRLADFRGYAVWAKSPLAGVYRSRRQGEATLAEIGALPPLPAGARLVDVMPWGGTHTTELRRRFGPGVQLCVAELSPHNLCFIAERLRQEGLSDTNLSCDLIRQGRLPYADDSIDAVFLGQTLEHMPQPERMLDEVRRVLRPGGTGVISARNLHSRYGRHYRRVLSREQVPNSGPFIPLVARVLERWLTERFVIEEAFGISLEAGEDATRHDGKCRFLCRLLVARFRKSASTVAHR